MTERGNINRGSTLSPTAAGQGTVNQNDRRLSSGMHI